MSEVINGLFLPIVAIIILALIMDNITSNIKKILSKIPNLPDHIEIYIAFLLIWLLGFLFCWQGNFDFFVHLGINFNYPWEAYLMTSLVISGGSVSIKNGLIFIKDIVFIIVSIKSKIKSSFVNVKENNSIDTQDKPELSEKKEEI